MGKSHPLEITPPSLNSITFAGGGVASKVLFRRGFQCLIAISSRLFEGTYYRSIGSGFLAPLEFGFTAGFIALRFTFSVPMRTPIF